LGVGDIDTRRTPTFIPTLTNIYQASSGQSHSLFLNNFGQVYSRFYILFKKSGYNYVYF
jgi:hypothetical protein